MNNPSWLDVIFFAMVFSTFIVVLINKITSFFNTQSKITLYLYYVTFIHTDRVGGAWGHGATELRLNRKITTFADILDAKMQIEKQIFNNSKDVLILNYHYIGKETNILCH